MHTRWEHPTAHTLWPASQGGGDEFTLPRTKLAVWGGAPADPATLYVGEVVEQWPTLERLATELGKAGFTGIKGPGHGQAAWHVTLGHSAVLSQAQAIAR